MMHMKKQVEGSPLIPNLPHIHVAPEVTLRNKFSPDVVEWAGALALADGRTLFVFEQGGRRRGVAVRGAITEFSEERTLREINRSRNNLLTAEASLDTIYQQGAVPEMGKPEPEQISVPVESIDEFIERKREADPTSKTEPEPESERKVLGSFDNMDPLPSWDVAPELKLEGRPSEKIEGWVDEGDRA